MTALFTIGYERRTVDDLIATLREHAVTRVIDVRELPLSRRKGFSKTALGDALAAAGIDYVHLRAAGNPFRAEGDIERYRDHLARSPEVVDLVIETARGQRAALLCLERDAAHCHRGILAAQVVRRAADLTVEHL